MSVVESESNLVNRLSGFAVNEVGRKRWRIRLICSNK